MDTNEWISVNDALPEDENEDVVITNVNERFPSFGIANYSRKYCRWYIQSANYELEHPTHWCRLPKLPSND